MYMYNFNSIAIISDYSKIKMTVCMIIDEEMKSS